MRTTPAAVALVLLAVVPSASAVPSPARVQAAASEFHLALSRPSLPAGATVVELVNYDQDDHDLALRRLGGSRTYRIGRVHPGSRGELEARLRPGRYVVWCTLTGHRARGMTAALRVGSPSASRADLLRKGDIHRAESVPMVRP